MKNILFILLLIVSLKASILAAKVDTVEVFSSSMKKGIKTVIISPSENKSSDKLPVIYLLHGYSGNYKSWIAGATQIKELSDNYQLILVCPDGGYGSWYWDIMDDKKYQYETFVTKELVKYIETHYPVIPDRKYRGITGLSMGGYGALYLALRHQDVFSVAGSTSGGVDFRPWPNSWEIKDRIGNFQENHNEWNKRLIINMLHLYKPKSIEIFIDCGTEDLFSGVNATLHREMKHLNIPHRFLTMPGRHDWEYWSQSIVFQLAFFRQHFK